MRRQSRFIPILLLVLAATPAAALSDSPYLAAGAFDVIHLLPPPPTPDSDAQRQDVEAVLQAQRTSTTERMRLAEADAQSDVARFADVLGANLLTAKMPTVRAFFAKVNRDIRVPVNLAKDCWERPRPFVVDSAVHPPGRMQQDTANPPGTQPSSIVPHDAESPCRPAEPPPAYSYSYPSGHSTFGAMTAILLANMIPEKRAELFARGWQFGESRVVGGVHFPTDVEAGRIEATAVVALMMQNAAFRTDFAAARAELRRNLGFPQ